MKGFERGTSGRLELPLETERLTNGNTLIADGGDETGAGSEILEVDPQGQIVWRYGNDLGFPHCAKRLENGNTVVVDTTNNRIIEVTPNKEIVFSSENWNGGEGRLSDGSRFSYPNDCHVVEGDRLFVTDRNNNRCLLVDREGTVHWVYDSGIRHPHNCEKLPNGNVLICDSDENKIIEINEGGKILWNYGCKTDQDLNWPRDADRLPNGNTLITDSKNNRVIEVDKEGKTVWRFTTDHFANFYEADKLKTGNVLISDQQHRRIIEVDPFGNVVWMFRNHRNVGPIHPRIKNGELERGDQRDVPRYWVLNNRLAEGGGKIIWLKDRDFGSAPGLSFDRSGLLFLQQIVAVEPERKYRMGAKLKTESVRDGGSAFIQTSFLDEMGGKIAVTAEAPKGTLFTGTNDWTADSFQTITPVEARAVQLRIALTGKGKVWARDVTFAPVE